MTKDDILSWLTNYPIFGYTINDDLTVDADHVNLDSSGLSSIPFQFNCVRHLFSINHCQFTSFTDSGLPRFVGRLEASHNQFTTLKDCPNAKELFLSENAIQSLAFLPVTCEKADLSFNQITDVADYPENLLLEELDLSHNPLIILKGIKEGVKSLYVSNCKLSDTRFLPQSLIGLDISDNQISVLSDLPPRLEYLNINHNLLTDLSGLPLHLKDLLAIENKITHLDNFQFHQEEMLTLHLDGNPLVSLAHFPIVSYVSLNRCGLTDEHLAQSNMSPVLLQLRENALRNPHFCEHLYMLDISQNPIESVSGLIRVVSNLVISIHEIKDLLIYKHLIFEQCDIVQSSHVMSYSESDIKKMIDMIEFKLHLDDTLLVKKPFIQRKI